MVGARARAQSVFVTLEMALALVLLVGAGLTIRTLMQLWNVDPGFNPQNVIFFDIAPAKSLSNNHPTRFERPSGKCKRPSARFRRGECLRSPGAVPMFGDDEEPFWPTA